MRVVEQEVAVADWASPTDVVHDRGRHVPAAVIRQAQPEAQIDILEVTEEPLVESAAARNASAGKARRPRWRRTPHPPRRRRRDRRDACQATPLTWKASPAASSGRVRRHHDPARKERVLGPLRCGREQLLEPSGLGKRIRIEQASHSKPAASEPRGCWPLRSRRFRSRRTTVHVRVPFIEPVRRPIGAALSTTTSVGGRVCVARRVRARRGSGPEFAFTMATATRERCTRRLYFRGGSAREAHPTMPRCSARYRQQWRLTSRSSERPVTGAVAAVRDRGNAIAAALIVAGIVLLSMVSPLPLALDLPAPWLMGDELRYSDMAKSFLDEGGCSSARSPSRS